MSRTGRIAFALRAGGHLEEELVVLRVEGREDLSHPFGFEVDFAPASGDPVDLAGLLGAPAALFLRRPDGGERVIHGECRRAALLEVAAGQPRYRLHLAPAIARLGVGVRSRVFQGKSVPDIVAQVLDERGVAHRAALRQEYPAREFVLQYRESDLAFLSRWLEAEGIWYRFEHTPDGHTLVLGDDGTGLAAGPGPLPVREAEQGEGVEHVFRLQRERDVVVRGVSHRDYDFEAPGVDLTFDTGSGEPDRHEYPSGRLAPADAKRNVEVRLEELRYAAGTVHGQGTAIGTAAGAKLALEGRDELAVVGVVHRGRQERAAGAADLLGSQYHNAFVAIPADRPFRPRRRTRWPRIAGIQTATVVGPAGEESHVDRHGRIRIRFHWDREGPRDDGASCWVRLAQPWAGSWMGASWVPRIGQEVVVRFLEGNPDRPLVTGAVYNGANLTPIQLPEDKTRSTLRSDSSIGGGGSNELRFEDAAGAEEVYHHAQRDLLAEVEQNATAEVRRDEAVEIVKDRSALIGGEQRMDVTGHESTSIGGNAETVVVGDRRTATAGAHEEVVAGAQTVIVGGERHVQIGKGAVTAVGGAAQLTVGGAYATSVGAEHQRTVGADAALQVSREESSSVGAQFEAQIGGSAADRTVGGVEVDIAGAMGLTVGNDDSQTVGRDLTLSMAGDLAASCARGSFSADSLVIVVGGKELLRLEKSGSAQLIGTAVSVGGTTLQLRGSPIAKSGPVTPAQRAAARERARQRTPALEVVLHIDPEDPRAKDDVYSLLKGDGSVVKKLTVESATRGKGRLTLVFKDLDWDEKYSLLVDEGKEGRHWAFHQETLESLIAPASDDEPGGAPLPADGSEPEHEAAVPEVPPAMREWKPQQGGES